MHMLRIGLIVIVLLAQTASNVLFSSTSYATPSTTIVISQVYAGITNGATQEFASLYNNSVGDVNVTGWCVTNKASVTFACVPSVANVAIFIRAHGYMTISSDSFSTAHSYQPDIKFVSTNQTSGSIVGGSETISLIDANSNIIDNIGWTTSLAAGSTLQRIETLPAGSGNLVDTDTATDFSKQLSLQIPNSGVYEVQTIIDVCPNILAAQSTIPSGLVFDQAGNCVIPPPVDVCLNINGLQLTVPIGFLKDISGACQRDVCVDLEGLQTGIPSGYESLDNESCTLIPLVSDLIQITELLPNPAGSDMGNEYIEFYNPNLHDVDLTGYVLWVGPGFEKSYAVPAHTLLPTESYIRFSNTDILYTLVNSSSRAKLVAPAGNTVSETPAYNNPLDNEAWAQINTMWQYTNQPTPAAANKVSAYEDTEVIAPVVTLAGCPAGKYRNTLTNRCRNIEADVSVLATCDIDEYRSPDTNRCRKVVVLASQVMACKDGQYRSEETNRCRNIVSSTTNSLVPCNENQERNSETNRCRNIVKSVPSAAFAVEPVKEGSKVFVGWWALGGVGVLAGGYGVWEWRREMAGAIRKVVASFISSK